MTLSTSIPLPHAPPLPPPHSTSFFACGNSSQVKNHPKSGCPKSRIFGENCKNQRTKGQQKLGQNFQFSLIKNDFILVASQKQFEETKIASQTKKKRKREKRSFIKGKQKTLRS